ncbi:hypothetical protein [Pseudomonas veronii]|uniref:hypothetical protein n=1 Tax=Pseudomonas veronii TaxID=76761 RepID=UPI002D7A26F8|nr:hypothetical protein [Pseudomonas veronii]WRU60307.1 hypothetical protein VPH48_18760 [Pseudomonas veronii]
MSVLKGISPSALNNLGPKEKCPEELGVSLRQKSKAPEVRGSRASIFASIPKRLANVVADYQRSPDVSLRLLAIVFDRQHAGEGGMISATYAPHDRRGLQRIQKCLGAVIIRV